MKGLAEIRLLYEKASKELEFVTYNGIAMKRLLCKTAIKHYEIGIKAYLGGLLANWLEMRDSRLGTRDSGTEARKELAEWVDVLGLMAPRSAVEALCDRIENGAVADVTALEREWAALHESYAENEWCWAQEAWASIVGKKPAEMSPAELRKAIEGWRDAVVKLDNMILNDAEKEFGTATRIGFGIDGDASVRDADFAAVRGTFETNKFVKELKRHAEETKTRAERILKGLE